ncbi:uncharacterized protein UTRI_00183 [Ustilago trichophora]|uniref:Uncharacterized protein n=1 Tax=Ustilago trichophora TaxID=86804 RepID=A0A5C3DTH4_9BASI|nr:uncharacterized protein UTRI_00183 [Ustilago trichophora]
MNRLSTQANYAKGRRKQSFSNGVDPQHRYQAQGTASSRKGLAQVLPDTPSDSRFHFHNDTAFHGRPPGHPHSRLQLQAQLAPSNILTSRQVADAPSSSTILPNSQYHTGRSRSTLQTPNHQGNIHPQNYPDVDESGRGPTSLDSESSNANQHTFLPQPVRLNSGVRNHRTADVGGAQGTVPSALPARNRTAPEADVHRPRSSAYQDAMVVQMKNHLVEAKQARDVTQTTVERLIDSYEGVKKSYESSLEDQAEFNELCRAALESQKILIQRLEQLPGQLAEQLRKATEGDKDATERVLQALETSVLRPRFELISKALQSIEESAERDRRINETRQSKLELSLQALQTSVCEQVDRVVFVCETLADNVREARSEEHQIYRREIEERQYAFDSLGGKMAAELRTSHPIRSTSAVQVSPISSPQSIGETVTEHDGTRQRDMRRAHSSAAYRFETSDNMLEHEAPREDSRRPRAERREEATPERRQVFKNRPLVPVESPLSEASEGSLSSISPLPTAVRTDVPISAAPTKEAPDPKTSAPKSPARKDTSKEDPARKVYARETPSSGPPAKKAPAKKASAKKAPRPSAKRATNKYGSSSKKQHLPSDQEGDEDEECDGKDRRGEGFSSRRDVGESSPSEDGPSSPPQEVPKRRGRKRKGSVSAPRRSRPASSDSEYAATGLVSNVMESSGTAGHRYSTRARGKVPKVAGVWF